MLADDHPDRIQIAFDDHRLVANAGLILPATLGRHLGRPELVDRHLDLGRAPGRANTGDKLDFTQNLEEATDAITLGRRHSWLESEGFSLSAANADVQELPATLYH